jgi:hypothetical protein
VGSGNGLFGAVGSVGGSVGRRYWFRFRFLFAARLVEVGQVNEFYLVYEFWFILFQFWLDNFAVWFLVFWLVLSLIHFLARRSG